MKNQNLNVGDKLLCKKDLTTSYSIYHKDRYYIVHFIINYDDDYQYLISDDKNTYSSFKYDEEYLYTYFYRKNEVRKIKLKKLYELT